MIIRFESDISFGPICNYRSWGPWGLVPSPAGLFIVARIRPGTWATQQNTLECLTCVRVDGETNEPWNPGAQGLNYRTDTDTQAL
jgi:hypothetical protein